jgi:hypothetical protein
LFSEVFEVLRDGAKLVAVLLGDDNQPTGSSGDRVGKAAGEVIVVAASVLILDDELPPVFNLGHDVDPSPSSSLDLELTSEARSTSMAEPSWSSRSTNSGVKSDASPFYALASRP